MKQHLFIFLGLLICVACGQEPVQHNAQATPVALTNTQVVTDTPVVVTDTPVVVTDTPVVVTDTPVQITATVASVVPTAQAVTAVAVPTITLTATKVAVAQRAGGWRFRNRVLPGAVFAHQGTHCGNGTNLSGEWVVSDVKTIEGVVITSRIIVTVNADQKSGVWRSEQFFEVEGVKSIGGVQGSIAQIRFGSDGVVAFDLNVGTPVQGKVIPPDGSETAFDYPMPVASLNQLEWEPLAGPCP